MDRFQPIQELQGCSLRQGRADGPEIEVASRDRSRRWVVWMVLTAMAGTLTLSGCQPQAAHDPLPKLDVSTIDRDLSPLEKKAYQGDTRAIYELIAQLGVYHNYQGIAKWASVLKDKGDKGAALYLESFELTMSRQVTPESAASQESASPAKNVESVDTPWVEPKAQKPTTFPSEPSALSTKEQTLNQQILEKLKASAEAGFPWAAYCYTLFHLRYEDQDLELYKEMKPWLEQAYKGGIVNAAADLGWIYQWGIGVEVDESKAIQLYEEAARANVAKGFRRFGQVYVSEFGVKKDDERAFQWFHHGARFGDTPSMAMVGSFYFLGRGVKHDPVKAYCWLALSYLKYPQAKDALAEVTGYLKKQKNFPQDYWGKMNQWVLGWNPIYTNPGGFTEPPSMPYVQDPLPSKLKKAIENQDEKQDSPSSATSSGKEKK